MSQRVCRDSFTRSAGDADVAVLLGAFTAQSAGSDGSSLDTLCGWLDLPRIAVVDASKLQECSLPALPSGVDAVLLDNVSGPRQRFSVQTNLEALWGVPVLGGMRYSPLLSSKLADLPANVAAPQDVTAALADDFLRDLDLPRLLQLLDSRPMFHQEPASVRFRSQERLRVAVAYDAAFNCYFPDTLDMLERSGVAVCDFSPLRDDSLPADTDIVYFGCGHPERYAEQLAANQCLINELRCHVCDGKRIYAEGGGLAYLCRQAESSDGRMTCMAGVLSAIARRNPKRTEPRPMEVSLRRGCWLGEDGSTFRGYLNDSWTVERCGPLTCHGSSDGQSLDVVGRHRVIGSRLHLNFAAQPALMRQFFAPCPAALDLVGTPDPGNSVGY